MNLSRDSSCWAVFLQRTRSLQFMVLVWILVVSSGCSDSTTDPVVSENISQTTTKKDLTTIPLTPEKSLPESAFHGLSAVEKLNRIGDTLQKEWGQGTGFLLQPDGGATNETEDPLVLTLRWQAIEKKVRPLLKEAFGINGDLRCQFTSAGEFVCNNPLYQLAIFRAQKRSSEFVSMHSRVNATLANYAPVLRDEFLLTEDRDRAFYETLQTSLLSMALPGGLLFDTQESSGVDSDNRCVLFTTWAPLPQSFSDSFESALFRWRLQLTIREAVGEIESESDNLRSEQNRLELVSHIQYCRNEDEPFPLTGPLSVTAMGFTPETQIFHWGSRYTTAQKPATEVLESPQEYLQVDVYPRPTTFVGKSSVMMSIITGIHLAIEQHLTKPEVAP